jgi:hypothetical protein
MKTTTSIVVLAITLAAVSVASADEKTKQVQATTTATVEKTKTTANHQYPLREDYAITGTYIKHKIRRAGEITDGSSQVLVLDSKMIAESGAADVKQLLINRGIH